MFFLGFTIVKTTYFNQQKITNSLQTLQSIVSPNRSRHPVLPSPTPQVPPENVPRHRLPGAHGVPYPLPTHNFAKNPLGRLQLQWYKRYPLRQTRAKNPKVIVTTTFLEGTIRANPQAKTPPQLKISPLFVPWGRSSAKSFPAAVDCRRWRGFFFGVSDFFSDLSGKTFRNNYRTWQMFRNCFLTPQKNCEIYTL